MSNPLILYLDQNKWIEIARCVKDPDRYPECYTVLEFLVRQAQANQLMVPLTFTNIYETHKVNDFDRRSHLAWVQATLSQGKVFRGRSALLRAQLVDHLSTAFSLTPPIRPEGWSSPICFLRLLSNTT